jgi:type IV secretory pathway VirB2 component (pilin)
VDRQDPPDRLRPAGEARASTGSGADTGDHDQPSFLSMVGLVALVVAVVILVFFGIGYLFGRVFL